jgi:hypothetical protein
MILRDVPGCTVEAAGSTKLLHRRGCTVQCTHSFLRTAFGTCSLRGGGGGGKVEGLSELTLSRHMAFERCPCAARRAPQTTQVAQRPCGLHITCARARCRQIITDCGHPQHAAEGLLLPLYLVGAQSCCYRPHSHRLWHRSRSGILQYSARHPAPPPSLTRGARRLDKGVHRCRLRVPMPSFSLWQLLSGASRLRLHSATSSQPSRHPPTPPLTPS